jgi:hypothetical protein
LRLTRIQIGHLLEDLKLKHEIKNVRKSLSNCIEQSRGRFSRFSIGFERASCDEGFIDVTNKVSALVDNPNIKYDNKWHGALFMGHDFN